MALVTCSDEWLTDSSGYLLCTGQVTEVVLGPLGLPPLTYEQATTIVGVQVGVWCAVLAVRAVFYLTMRII